MIAYGQVSGIVLAVAYVWRGDKRRLISDRKATRNEAKNWFEVIHGKAKNTGE